MGKTGKTRKRRNQGWAIVGMLVIGIEGVGAAAPQAVQTDRPSEQPPTLSNLVPRGDQEVEWLEGASAWRLLEERAIAPYRNAWSAALKVKEDRGWKKTKMITALRTRARTGLTNTQSQSFNIGDGLLIEWQWDCGPDAACGTYYYESYYFGSTIVYDASFVPTGDRDGYSPWANYIGGSPGSDSRRQRQARAGQDPEVRTASFETGQGAPCPGDLWSWRQCMRGCLERQHSTGLRGAAVAAGGSLIGCLGKMRPAPIEIMGLSYIGCVTLSAGAAALLSFSAAFTWEPCDAAGQCGPRPC
jgi:hypothetical protein